MYAILCIANIYNLNIYIYIYICVYARYDYNIYEHNLRARVNFVLFINIYIYMRVLSINLFNFYRKSIKRISFMQKIFYGFCYDFVWCSAAKIKTQNLYKYINHELFNISMNFVIV